MTLIQVLTALAGTKDAHRENAYVALIMLVVTLAYQVISSQVLQSFSFNAFEFVGTWAGLVCVWLCRTENVLCWPWGIVSAVSFGFFFGSIGLPGQQWLNWGYFLIIQIISWPHWVFGGRARTKLPVTTLVWRERVFVGVALVLGTAMVYVAIDLLVPGSVYPVLDAIVVASSVVAQYLLGRKKVESWILWLGPVNLLSIILFFSAGAYTVMALYVAFFIHALFAIQSWKRAQVFISR
jgi:nicotinamide mononucleotide transporter